MTEQRAPLTIRQPLVKVIKPLSEFAGLNPDYPIIILDWEAEGISIPLMHGRTVKESIIAWAKEADDVV